MLIPSASEFLALDWFLDRKVDEKVTLARGELICLVRSGTSQRRWHVWWLLTPRARAAAEQLRAKILSKMTVLSVVAGFATVLLVHLVSDLAKPVGISWYFRLAAAITYAFAVPERRQGVALKL